MDDGIKHESRTKSNSNTCWILVERSADVVSKIRRCFFILMPNDTTTSVETDRQQFVGSPVVDVDVDVAEATFRTRRMTFLTRAGRRRRNTNVKVVHECEAEVPVAFYCQRTNKIYPRLDEIQTINRHETLKSYSETKFKKMELSNYPRIVIM